MALRSSMAVTLSRTPIGRCRVGGPQPQAHGGEMGPVALRGVAPRARRVPPKNGRTGICDLPSCCSGKPCASRDLSAWPSVAAA
jgi:hypothetical protein